MASGAAQCYKNFVADIFKNHSEKRQYMMFISFLYLSLAEAKFKCNLMKNVSSFKLVRSLIL